MSRNKDTFEIIGHLKALGIKDLGEYRNWCIQHNFSTNTNKSSLQRSQELGIRQREKADKQLKKAKKNKNQNVVIKYLDDYLNDRDLTGYELYGNLNKLHTLLLNINEKDLRQFCNLVSYLATKIDCLFELIHAHSSFIDALVNICKYHEKFIRVLEDWKPKSHNSWNQFVSLCEHLFVKYEMPLFMYKAWFGDENSQKWFLYLATGANIRNAPDFPVELTKKQAHYFCQAPKNYSILGAIRYGQVISFGGTNRLADVLVPTRICLPESFPENEFWESVIRWFIENPMLDLVQAGPIIDWLHDQKFVRYADGIKQPNLSMKKRDPEATLRHVEEWHFQLGRSKKGGNLVWGSCGIEGFRLEEGMGKNQKIWTIRELLSSKELQLEGRVMHHCVSTYSASCNSGRSSIWTLELTDSVGLTQKRATLEVQVGSKMMTQARGKYNERLAVTDKNIVARWAHQRGISLTNYI